MRRSLLVPASLAAFALISPLAHAQDDDGDGVPNGADAFPCDARASAESFHPAEGAFGMLLFEDFWPEGLDSDYNDLIVAHNYAFALDAQGRLVRLRAVYQVMAAGGWIDQGIGLVLPVPRGAVASGTRTITGGPAGAQRVTREALAPSLNDASYTVVLSSDVRFELFGSPADRVVNAVPGSQSSAATLEVEIELAAPTAINLALAPFDVFSFRTADPSHEIHRSPYCGTSQMDTALFGAGVDNSNLAAARCYTDHDGLPAALSVPALVSYPAEEVDIAQLYPNILAWAASGGTTQAGWYTTPQSGYAYPTALTPAFPGGVTRLPSDRSCIPVVPRSCLDIRDGGVTTSGVYTIDPDGDGGLAAFTVYCEMNVAGGGWTLLSNRRAGSTNTEACGANLAQFFTNGCGSPGSIGATQSYALNQARRVALPRTQVMVLQYLNGVLDADDAYVVDLMSSGQDLFPNTVESMNIPLARACNLAGTFCDTTDVFWKYIGDYWYHSSMCWSGSSFSTQYRGNYGLCHNGAANNGSAGSYSSSSFVGDRVGYQETKLWAHPNEAAAYQERIFVR